LDFLIPVFIGHRRKQTLEFVLH